jgi:hypothetical protein
VVAGVGGHVPDVAQANEASPQRMEREQTVLVLILLWKWMTRNNLRPVAVMTTSLENVPGPMVGVVMPSRYRGSGDLCLVRSSCCV